MCGILYRLKTSLRALPATLSSIVNTISLAFLKSELIDEYARCFLADEESLATSRSVSRCLRQWGGFDLSVCVLYCQCLRPRSQVELPCISIRSMTSRLRL